MSAALKVAGAVTAPGAAPRPSGRPDRSAVPGLARRLAARLGRQWVPRAAWTLSRTGRSGLVGLALLLAAGLFLVSTHLKVVAEVESLRADLARAQRQAREPAADQGGEPVTTLRALPGRSDMPAVLRQLFNEASRARLSVDTARYEVNATKGSGVVRHQISFPVVGPYPQIREFIDGTLLTMPAVGLNDLVLERKSIGDGQVEAQIRLTVYTRSDP